MPSYYVLVPLPGTQPALLIDPGSGIIASFEAIHALPDVGDPNFTGRERVLVYYEGNRFNASNLLTFESRVNLAADRLAKNYPTVARNLFPIVDFMLIGMLVVSEDFRERHLEVVDPGWLKLWLGMKPEIYKQRVPCVDCPFRREGGVRHSLTQMVSYIRYFTADPATTFPCHKSVPKTDPRDKFSDWQDGQVLCAGGLIFAAKQGLRNSVVRHGVLQRWYDPAIHTADERAIVFDSIGEMLDGCE
jgi:hypothetical protein